MIPLDLPAIRSRFRMRRILLPKALRRFALLALAAAVCGWPSAPGAQSNPAPVIGAIHSSGQKRFSEAKVITASGLQTGKVFDLTAVEAATQKLAQSGAFDEVQFKYRPDNGKMNVEFVVKEATRFHRCTYDNFVWASSKEIEDFVRAEISLFDGYAPESGNLPDEIARSLEHFLLQRGIAGQVDRLQYARAIGDPNWEHLYSVNGPIIRVQTVVFQGVKGIDEGLLQKEAKPLLGRNYSLVECRKYAEASFVPVYRERGFLRVNIGNPAGQLLKQTGGSSELPIQVNYPVEEGLAYDWGAASWDGNHEASTEELNALLSMKHGERANGKKLDAGWEAIQAAYGKKGYMEARLKPDTAFDEASHKVEFHVQVTEGSQYRMGEFSVKGVPMQTAERLKSRWKLKSGDIYDASYMSEFLKTQMGQALGASGGKTQKIQTSVRPDRVAHTVDILVEVQ
jgi:outer membrane protein assembly factor BamA